MTTNPQLPDDFVDGYWEVVVEELCDLGLSETDARAAAAGYRAYMKPAEWAVYNRPTAYSAKMAHLWLQRHGATASATPGPSKLPVANLIAATRSQLPDDFIDGYWDVVIEELCDDYGMSQQDAQAAVAVYRARMAPAGDTVYNDSTRESAQRARYSFQRYRHEAKSNLLWESAEPNHLYLWTYGLMERVAAIIAKERLHLPADKQQSALIRGYDSLPRPDGVPEGQARPPRERLSVSSLICHWLSARCDTIQLGHAPQSVTELCHAVGWTGLQPTKGMTREIHRAEMGGKISTEELVDKFDRERLPSPYREVGQEFARVVLDWDRSGWPLCIR